MNAVVALIVFAVLAVFVFRDVVATPACEREFGGKGLVVDSHFDLGNLRITCRITQARSRPLTEKLWENGL